MTFILACATNNDVYLVCDRRLTAHGARHVVLSDTTNKATIVNGRIVFGYSGRSHIGDERADEWFAGAAAEATHPPAADNLRAAMEQIAAKATSAFNDINAPPRYKRQAFLASDGSGLTASRI